MLQRSAVKRQGQSAGQWWVFFCLFVFSDQRTESNLVRQIIWTYFQALGLPVVWDMKDWAMYPLVVITWTLMNMLTINSHKLSWRTKLLKLLCLK